MPPVFSRETTRVFVQDASHAGQGRTSPCECRCPAGNPIQKMERAIADGNEALALEYLRARNPFPGVTGRVCPHPCETGCNRNSYDEGVAIRALERHAADYGSAFRRMKSLPSTGKRIAVIGSGPAGLTCAYFSALLGHTVDVFEASPVAGGVPRQAIPDFRLPKAVVDREVGLVLGLGVNILTNTAVGGTFPLPRCWNAITPASSRRATERSAVWTSPASNTRSRPSGSCGNRTSTAPGSTANASPSSAGAAWPLTAPSRSSGWEPPKPISVFLEDMGHVRVPAEEIRQAEDEGIRLHPSHLASAVHCGNGTVSGRDGRCRLGLPVRRAGQPQRGPHPRQRAGTGSGHRHLRQRPHGGSRFSGRRTGRGAHPARFHRRRSGNGHDLEAGPVRRRGMRLRAFPCLAPPSGKGAGQPLPCTHS